jgi:hypothetical protein
VLGMHELVAHGEATLGPARRAAGSGAGIRSAWGRLKLH